ncbi:MAG: DUF3050 domain-containing protein [Planctomycetota bacterium]
MTTTAHTAHAEVAGRKAALSDHAAYRTLHSLDGLRRFMEHHAICVLDFMSIVKSLQRELTSVGPVWLPPADGEVARFINEIVLDEESDAAFEEWAPGRGPRSHFEWYLEAMDEVGADSGPIRSVVERLRAGEAPAEGLEGSGLPDASVAFGRTTFELLEGPLHVRAAVFFHGREDLIPRMFTPLLDELERGGTPCNLLRGYLARHIEADGEHHGPLAERMLARLFDGDPAREAEGFAAAARALDARRALWDAVTG